MPPSDRCAFGDFTLEPAQERVTRADGTQLNLTPRQFAALLLFVQRAGDLLDKDSLMLALWPGLVVEENNLSQVVSGLRRALGDDAQGSRYIQTVPRRGFRFIAKVTQLPDDPPQGAALDGPAPAPAQEPAAPLAGDVHDIAVAHPPAPGEPGPERAPIRSAGITPASGAVE